MASKNKNPYFVKTSDLRRIWVHKDLVTALNREKMKQQRISNSKFGKNKMIVPRNFASKILGGLLK